MNESTIPKEKWKEFVIREMADSESAHKVKEASDALIREVRKNVKKDMRIYDKASQIQETLLLILSSGAPIEEKLWNQMYEDTVSILSIASN